MPLSNHSSAIHGNDPGLLKVRRRIRISSFTYKESIEEYEEFYRLPCESGHDGKPIIRFLPVRYALYCRNRMMASEWRMRCEQALL